MYPPAEAEYQVMKTVNCNLCGADDYKVRFQKGEAQIHRIVICNRCGFMYANPQEAIDCERLQAAEDPQVYDAEENRLYFEKQQTQLPDNLHALRVLNELCPKRGNLLEIGSFCGIFLNRIRQDGWTVSGLDPDRSAAQYARKTYGLNIVNAVLPCPELPTQNYDAVVMLHVIEHMPDPSENLVDIYRILKPGGVLVVETPRFDSLIFKILGRRERSLSNCYGHIQFFTVPSLRAMLEKCGFEVVRVDLVGRTLTLERFMYNVGLMLRSKRLARWIEKLGNVLHFNRFKFHVNARDMQRIYARAKPVAALQSKSAPVCETGSKPAAMQTA